MMKLQIHNDGKEKYQSFEARLQEVEPLVFLDGYGENKEEAIQNLKTNVQEKIRELQNIDYNNFDWIAWDGKVINKAL